MDLDGFHVTDHRGHVGMQASPSSVERASPIPVKQRNAWKYHESMPESAKNIDRYYYGYDDIEQLTREVIEVPQSFTVSPMNPTRLAQCPGWDERTVKALQRKYGWRWRLDHTTRRREFYLYDILATAWSYMLEWQGNRVDPDLLQESRDYIRSRGITASTAELCFPLTSQAHMRCLY